MRTRSWDGLTLIKLLCGEDKDLMIMINCDPLWGREGIFFVYISLLSFNVGIPVTWKDDLYTS